MQCSCGSGYDGDWDGNYWEFLRVKSKWRKAFCVECHTQILPGQRYLSMNWLGPDGGAHAKRCVTCHNMAKGMNHEGRIGSLHEDIADCLGMPVEMVWTECDSDFEFAADEIVDAQEINDKGNCSIECPLFDFKYRRTTGEVVGGCFGNKQEGSRIPGPKCPYLKKWKASIQLLE